MDRLLRQMTALPFESVRAAWIARARGEADRTAEAREWLRGYGYDELVGVPDDALLTADGREILRAQGKVWALKPEAHARQLADALEQAKQRDATVKQSEQRGATPAVSATCTTLIDGQLCGGTLVKAAVCPRCALGKSGVAATLTCDVCGHVTAVMREAK